MKLTKSLFKTEIEFETKELNELYGMPNSMIEGLFMWLKQTFGLNFFGQARMITNKPKLTNFPKGQV